MIRPLPCTVLVAAMLLPVGTSRAAESYDNCTGFIDSLPATITSQGTWCLDRDLSTNLASGHAITIATNNVILDCNHFKIGNLAAGPSTTSRGIGADGAQNTTIRNCNIRGFRTGAWFNSGGGQLIERNTFNGNTVVGIYVFSGGSTVRDNLVLDTGGSTAVTNVAYGISASNGVDVLNNTVDVVAAIGSNADAYGISTALNGSGSVNGNRVRNLVPSGLGIGIGIYAGSSGQGVIRDNDVQGPGSGWTGSVGVYCSNAATTARDNVVVGFDTGITGCFSSANAVNTN